MTPHQESWRRALWASSSGVLRAFVHGLTTHSLGSALAVIGFTVAELALAMVVVQPRTLARIDPLYLKEDRSDDLAVGTVRALALQFARSDRRCVVYIGSSLARRALVDDGIAMPEELSLAAGEPIDFYELAMNNQRMGEWPVLLDQVPEGFRGLVVLTVSDQMTRFVTNRSRDRLALVSPTFDRHPSSRLRRELRSEGVVPPRRTGIYFLDHLGFFASRRSILARIGPAPRSSGRGARRATESRWRHAQRRVERQPAPPTLEQLERLALILAPLRERAVDVVLLEAPVNPRFDRMKPERSSRAEVYEPAIREFSRNQGIPYWNPSVDAELSEDDFADEFHLKNIDAQRRFEAALVHRIGARLRGDPVSDGSETPEVDRATPGSMHP